MDEITKEYQSRMGKKLAWMQYTTTKIKEQKDQNIIEFYFWGYISAFYAITEYFGEWVSQKYPSKSKIHVNDWVNNNLDKNSVVYWHILYELRKMDQHRSPVIARYKNFPARLQLEGGLGNLLTEGGNPIDAGMKKVFYVKYKAGEHLLSSICDHGIRSVKKFINDFHQNNKNSPLR